MTGKKISNSLSYRDLSKQEIIDELLKCGKDPLYFINTFCKIAHPIYGSISFHLYDYQGDIITKFNNFKYNIILKARQMGMSTTVAAYIAWLMLFHKEKSVLVIATKFSVAGNIVKKVNKMIKALPLWFESLAKVTIDNRASFILSNGSAIQASTTAVDAGRSEALSLLVVDEAAHIKNFEDIWTALSPTLATGGRCIALSSPYGQHGWFYETYTKADRGESNFHPTKLHWRQHPERDDEWERQERKKYSLRRFAQEYETEFLGSGNSLISGPDLVKLKGKIKPPLYTTGINGSLWVWEQASPAYAYVALADVARGDGEDYSTFQVMKLETMDQVAEFKEKITPDLLARILYDIGLQYNQAMIVVENNSFGFGVLEKLQNVNYPNLYYSKKATHEYVPPYLANRGDKNIVPGWTTSTTTRPGIFIEMEEAVRTDLINLVSERLFRELETFVFNAKGRPEASPGHNDDLVIPVAIMCAIQEAAVVASQKGLGYRRAILQNISVVKSSMSTEIPGQIGYNPKHNSFAAYRTNGMTKADIKNHPSIKFAGLLRG